MLQEWFSDSELAFHGTRRTFTVTDTDRLRFEVVLEVGRLGSSPACGPNAACLAGVNYDGQCCIGGGMPTGADGTVLMVQADLNMIKDVIVGCGAVCNTVSRGGAPPTPHPLAGRAHGIRDATALYMVLEPHHDAQTAHPSVFCSPERLKSSVCKATDVWAAGGMTFHALKGKYPFYGADMYVIFKQIFEQDVDFVGRMLDKDARTRMCAGEALEHPWLCM
jgi:hypothetical protein